MIEITSETTGVTGLETVLRIHRRYSGILPLHIRRRRLMKIRRPSMGDRMDNSAERKYRHEQLPEDLALEQAQVRVWNQQAAIGNRHHGDSQPYGGSRLESEHRSRQG